MAFITVGDCFRVTGPKRADGSACWWKGKRGGWQPRAWDGNARARPPAKLIRQNDWNIDFSQDFQALEVLHTEIFVQARVEIPDPRGRGVRSFWFNVASYGKDWVTILEQWRGWWLRDDAFAMDGTESAISHGAVSPGEASNLGVREGIAASDISGKDWVTILPQHASGGGSSHQSWSSGGWWFSGGWHGCDACDRDAEQRWGQETWNSGQDTWSWGQHGCGPGRVEMRGRGVASDGLRRAAERIARRPARPAAKHVTVAAALVHYPPGYGGGEQAGGREAGRGPEAGDRAAGAAEDGKERLESGALDPEYWQTENEWRPADRTSGVAQAEGREARPGHTEGSTKSDTEDRDMDSFAAGWVAASGRREGEAGAVARERAYGVGTGVGARARSRSPGLENPRGLRGDEGLRGGCRDALVVLSAPIFL